MKITMKFRHQHDEEATEKERAATRIETTDPSLTKQSFKDEVDINVMTRRMGITDGGQLPAAMHPGYFGDFSDAGDFRDALDKTREAQRSFDALPANLRERFANDPVRLYNWVTRPENSEEAVRLGLLHKRAAAKKPEPLEVRVVADPAPKTPNGVT